MRPIKIKNWFTLRLEHAINGRYYLLYLQQDLFGQWTVTKMWGGKIKQKPRELRMQFKHYCEAMKAFKTVYQKKQRRGYVSK